MLTASDPMCSVELQDGGGEKSAEGIADLLCDVKAGETLSKLFLCIPGGQVVDCTCIGLEI